MGVDIGARSIIKINIDSSIERTAKINLYKLDARFNQSRVNFESFHGNVLLTGQVPDQHLKQLAEDNVRAMTDVKTVHNFITVGPQIGYSTIMQDTTVTANTRGLLMKAPVVADSKVRIHTENGVLYVMGRLNTAEIQDLNAVLQQVGNVSKIVMLVDNIEQQTTPNTLAPPMLQPAVATPFAIDPDQQEPTSYGL